MKTITLLLATILFSTTSYAKPPKADVNLIPLRCRAANIQMRNDLEERKRKGIYNNIIQIEKDIRLVAEFGWLAFKATGQKERPACNENYEADKYLKNYITVCQEFYVCDYNGGKAKECLNKALKHWPK